MSILKEDFMNNFSQSLKNHRTLNGLTQKQMADKLEMTPNAYQKYELNTREPNLDTLIQIADILKISLDELVGRDFSQTPLVDSE